MKQVTSTTNEYSETIANHLAKKLEDSDSKLLRKISKSLQRDQKYPLSYLAKKGVSFFYRMLVSKIILRKCDSTGKGIRVEKKPYLQNQGEMHIGNNVNICSRKVACDLVSYPGGKLEIGDNTFINFGTTLCAKNRVHIGKNVKLGPYCMIHDTDFHIQGEDYKEAQGVPIIIEDDAWLSSRVLVMKGSIIGKGSIIAAGSVVSGIIPPNVIAGGVPAKVIKYRDPSNSQKSQEKEVEIDPQLKEETDKIIENVLGRRITELPPNTNVSEIPEWTAENHKLILNTLQEHTKTEINSKQFIRMNSLKRIYYWVQQATYVQRNL